MTKLPIRHSLFPIRNSFIVHCSLFILLLPALQPLFTADFTCGYDNGFHLWRAVQVEHLLRQGVLFSRWAPDMAHGFGYPLFDFAAPASAYGAALLRLLGLPWPWALNLAFALGWVLAAYTVYLFVSDLFDRYAGLVAAVLYTYVPFHAYDVFYRGGLSQSSAWLFPPLILWALRRADRRVGFAVTGLSFAGLILTHNAFALLFAPLLLAYLLVVGYQKGRGVALWGGLALLVGLGLSAFFWLPALADLRFVHSERLSGAWVFEYANNFLPLEQLFALPRNADPTLINDSPARGLGLIPVLLAVVGLLALRDRWRRLQVAFFAGALAVCLFLILPVSRPVWDHLPLLQRVQFPWRLVGPATLCAAVLAGAATNLLAYQPTDLPTRSPRRLSLMIHVFLILLLILAHLGWFYPRHCSPPGDISITGMIGWERASHTVGTTAKGEYMPVWVHGMPEDPALDAAYATGDAVIRLPPESLPEGARVFSADYGPLDATVELESPVPFRARYLAFYYPGWRVTVDDNLIPIAPTDSEGLISFDVPAGRHTIRVRFGETPLRLAADALSLVALVALVALLALSLRSRITHHATRNTQHATRNTFHVSRLLHPASPILWGITFLTALFLLAFSLNLSPYLRGPQEWRWAYAIPGRLDRLWIPALTLALYLVLAFVWVRHAAGDGDVSRWRRGLILLALVLAVPLIQVGLLSAEQQDFLRPLFYRTVSAGASGVFSVGSTIEDAGDFLRRYPALMPTFPVHPQRYPPGLPLLFYLARRLLEQAPFLADALGFRLRLYQCHDLSLMRLSNATIGSAVIQMMLPLVSGFTLLPLYGLARRAYGRRTAAWAVALYPLVPSLALWSARWEQLYPLLACTACYFFHVGLTQSRRSALLVAGFTLSLASLLNFSVVALLLPMGLFALLWLLTQPDATRNTRHATRNLIAFLVGLSSLWLTYQLAFGTGLLDIWRVSMSYHLGLNRSYWAWLGYHLYDFFIFLGLPLALLFFVALAKAVRATFHATRNTQHATRNAQFSNDPLTLSFALGLLLLDLSGTARGEVARVWLFLTPFAVLVAARGLTYLCHPPRRREQATPEQAGTSSSGRCAWEPESVIGFVIVACLLALQLFTFNTFLRVVTTGLTDPPTHTRVFDPPPIAHPLDARFGDSIALLGYNLEPDDPAPGDTLHLTLYWRSLKPMTRPYTVFTHLVGPDGQLIGQQDHMPLRGDLPTTCWVPGEVIADYYDIPISSQSPPGDYVLETGFYLLETGERLPVTGSAAAADNRVILAPVGIGER
ncbi:MAG: glycosyltransferase family 39 protein [Anaerolineae bacterium]